MITVYGARVTTECNECGSLDVHKEVSIGGVVLFLCEHCLAELSVEIDREFV
jgi:translation initiation factor 2 beta subunit (eIF-2beta)/eIF-5